jgi:hypothetical protein
MLAAVDGLTRVTVCDCFRARRPYVACRHTSYATLLMFPALYRLWYDYQDAVERTGSESSPEARRLRHELEDAEHLLRVRVKGRAS